MTKDEALKLALEALEDISSHYMSLPKKGCMALAAIEEALAEQETVLPGGGHVPAVPVAVYGYCPECGGAGVMRERRPNGDDKCTNGHKYPSSKALAEQPAQPKGCLCPACKVTPHASDCAVHNEPAYQKGSCDCGAQQWNAGVPSLYPEPEPGVSIKATYEQPAQQQEPKLPEFYARFEDGLVSVYQRREDATPLLLLRENLPDKQPAQQQEPVAWLCKTHERSELVRFSWETFGQVFPLYTTPPQRKPLPAHEIVTMYDESPTSDSDMIAFARAIEAAHGIKE